MYGSRPIGAFLTLNTWQEVRHANFMSSQTDSMKPASAPSNYIWENLKYGFTRRAIALTIALLVMSLILFFAYRFQFFMQKSVSHFDNYEKLDCARFENYT